MRVKHHKSKPPARRNTPQRRAILEFLEGNTGHPSAEEIYRGVSGRFPGLALATVYNTLDTLKDSGEVQELQIDSERRRYDPCVQPHHHLICVSCRKVVDVDLLLEVEIPEEKASGFEVFHRTVQFFGLCPVCRGKHQGEGSSGL